MKHPIDDTHEMFIPDGSKIPDAIRYEFFNSIATEYKRNRSAEYPPMTDYLDGIVKGDQEQVNKYIADCIAVKAKYPKS